jgi:hypothetical protein
MGIAFGDRPLPVVDRDALTDPDQSSRRDQVGPADRVRR